MEKVNRKRVARLKRCHGMQARHKQRYKITTKPYASRPVAPNVLAQDFNAATVNEKWLADITHIDTQEGWLYLAAVLDVYSRQIVGWPMSERLHERLVEDVLRMALGGRNIVSDLRYHRCQYTSAA